MDTSHYGVLGIAWFADPEEVKRAHRKLALKWHPDKVEDPTDEVAVKVATQQFQLLQAAYEVLSNPDHRRRYDAELRCQRPSSTPCSKRPKAETTSQPWRPTEKAFLRVPADYQDISAAVEALPTCGGTIQVDAGTYVGLVVIAKPFVAIIARQNTVVVEGQVVFRHCAMGARLEGLVIRSSCAAGALDLKGVVGNVTVIDCDISNSKSAGVIFEGSSGTTKIQGCKVHDCKYDGLGMHVSKGRQDHKGTLNVVDCVFERNGYDGLYLGDARYTVCVQNCSISKNNRHGVLVRGAVFEMESCQIEDNGGENVRHEKPGQTQTSMGCVLSKSVVLCSCGAQFRFELTKFCANCGAARPGKMSAVTGVPECQTPDLLVTRPSLCLDPSPSLPEGWTSHRTEEGHRYYHHASSGVSQWTPPC
mmetsp:Transcript_47718/g.126361  ORF Transcript_47718/g.126361 Transcript_47718/m.126361 type:complete len:419 (-) Transcript_47718:35-1291(-)